MKTNSGVAYGEWLAPSIGSVLLDPVKLDIDHLVPLENAHWSGGYAWDFDRKRAYANDLNNTAHLVAVTASANRSKGARGPEDWRPPDEAHWCQYSRDWMAVKVEWELTVTQREVDALGEMLKNCSRLQCHFVLRMQRVHKKSAFTCGLGSICLPL